MSSFLHKALAVLDPKTLDLLGFIKIIMPLVCVCVCVPMGKCMLGRGLHLSLYGCCTEELIHQLYLLLTGTLSAYCRNIVCLILCGILLASVSVFESLFLFCTSMPDWKAQKDRALVHLLFYHPL